MGELYGASLGVYSLFGAVVGGLQDDLQSACALLPDLALDLLSHESVGDLLRDPPTQVVLFAPHDTPARVLGPRFTLDLQRCLLGASSCFLRLRAPVGLSHAEGSGQGCGGYYQGFGIQYTRLLRKPRPTSPLRPL